MAMTTGLIAHQADIDLDNFNTAGIETILSAAGHLKLKLVHPGTSAGLTIKKSDVSGTIIVYLIIVCTPNGSEST